MALPKKLDLSLVLAHHVTDLFVVYRKADVEAIVSRMRRTPNDVRSGEITDRERRSLAGRNRGMTWKAVGELLDISAYAAKSAAERALWKEEIAAEAEEAELCPCCGAAV